MGSGVGVPSFWEAISGYRPDPLGNNPPNPFFVSRQLFAA